MTGYLGYIALVPRRPSDLDRLYRNLPDAVAAVTRTFVAEGVWYDQQPLLPAVGHKLSLQAFGLTYTMYQWVERTDDVLVVVCKYEHEYLAPGGKFVVDQQNLEGLRVVVLQDGDVDEQVRILLAA